MRPGGSRASTARGSGAHGRELRCRNTVLGTDVTVVEKELQ